MRKYYKRLLTISLACFVAIIVGLIAPQTVNSKITTNVPSDISEDELKALVIEDFEAGKTGEQGWNVLTEPRKYNPKTAAETEKKLKRRNPVPILDLKILGGAPNDLNVEEWSLTGQGKKKEKILGIRFKFRYPGENSVHIIAPPELEWRDKKPVLTYNPSTRKDEQERAVQLPGRAKGISLWVHGRGNPYFLEVWIKDYRGDTHILKFGSINFVGWKPMSVIIPERVPQEYQSYPQTKVTKITRFVLRCDTRAHHEELTNETFFFFDQLKVLTDMYEVNFDGQNLHKSFKGGSSDTKKTDTTEDGAK